MNATKVLGWNVAHLNGGLLLSADNFSVQFEAPEVDKLIDILNSGEAGKIRDNTFDSVEIYPNGNLVILKRSSDKVYPDGIILPVSVFSDLEDDSISEGVIPAFRRVGNKIMRGFRVTSGRRKGQVVANAATAYKPPVSGGTRAKLRAAAHRNRFIRALKSARTKHKGISLRLRRLNHTD